MTLDRAWMRHGDILVEDVRTKIEAIPTVEEADVELTFDPPWNHMMMSTSPSSKPG